MKVQRYVLYTDTQCKAYYELQTLYDRKKKILDDKEKEYLNAVIKPFRDRVIYIRKDCYHFEEWISIYIEGEHIELPYFKEGTMYKGMELDKEYSIGELGL